MSDKFYRSTYLNVDLSAILNNYNTVRTLHSDKTVIPVVKANSYGLGSVKIAQHLMKNGADFLQEQLLMKLLNYVCMESMLKYLS